MATIKVVNITPKALSGDVSQDSEPFLTVNPEQPLEMVATAFTPDPMNGALAPVYLSTDGGDTWVLRSIVPGDRPGFGTADITVSFARQGGALYAGILNGQASARKIDRLQILRAPSAGSTAPMEVLVSRDGEDQPWVIADTVVVGGSARDRVYVGNNGPGPRTARVDVSADARTAPAPSGFTGPTVIEQRDPAGQDGPPVRLAVHPDGTVYAAFESWRTNDFGLPIRNVTFDVVVTRDDAGGVGATPFRDLKDATDSAVGQRVVTDRFVAFNSNLGEERLGGDLTVAVDPNDSNSVWIAWCDRVGGPSGTDNTLHVRHSTNRGETWKQVRDDVTDAKNPALAVNSQSQVGLVYQLFDGNRDQWSTILEVTADGWRTAPEATVLHQASGHVPTANHLPFLGDYLRLVALGTDFYGIFAGNNTPDLSNFPVGVTYQRNHNFATRQLLAQDGVSPVPISIDPFFFHRAA